MIDLAVFDIAGTTDGRRQAHRDQCVARRPRPMPGVADLFAELRSRGVAIALTTGFDRDVTSAVLAAVGWADDDLDAVVCTEDVPSGPVPHRS